jgi:hypothetical protein
MRLSISEPVSVLNMMGKRPATTDKAPSKPIPRVKAMMTWLVQFIPHNLRINPGCCSASATNF